MQLKFNYLRCYKLLQRLQIIQDMDLTNHERYILFRFNKKWISRSNTAENALDVICLMTFMHLSTCNFLLIACTSRDRLMTDSQMLYLYIMHFLSLFCIP